ncbi:MAG: glycosyltransferase family 4 protein [Planctomycetes bacterium]|nr:glycosyltransferase family 4 protein [Planctomycetota bacterium]
MNILVLAPAPYDTSPGQRFRIEQWARYLEPEGVRFTFVPFETPSLHRVLYQPKRYVKKGALMLHAFGRRLTLLGKVRKFDLVYIPREAALIGPAVIERLAAMLGAPLVYDFDDPIWLRYRSPQNGFFSLLKFPGKTAAICRLATRVITGNRLLAEWAQQHAANVDVVPSTIDTKEYPVKSHGSNGGKVTLGWTGSHSTLPFLDVIQEPLSTLASTHSYRLLVISHTDTYRRDSLPVEVVSRRWAAATEGADLHRMDIGLGPFPNSGWTPWRCHGKVLQYMAAGLPSVVSDIGIVSDYIQDGVNGFLARSDQEWIEKISLLIQDASLRARMGQAARVTIEEHYSASVWAPRVRGILEAALESHGKKRRLAGRA